MEFEVKINKKNLMKEVMSASSLHKVLESEIDEVLGDKQEMLVKKFVIHPVTQEIKGGIGASNASGTMGGYGNLFSFIGFEQGEDPTTVIEAILKQKIQFKVLGLSGTGKFKIKVFLPSSEQVFKNTPMPWANSLSWAEGVEKGISNLGSFLYSTSGRGSSRSGGGFQTDVDLSRNFTPTPYIEDLIEDFKKELKTMKL